uniref:BURP domain-containing protein n=1 Tax=Salix viminalis TaxID=40686 RepID=A0A6N2NIK2_SALVM
MEFTLVGSHAALPPELYWNNELPDTPMPKPVRDLLHPDLTFQNIPILKRSNNLNETTSGSLPCLIKSRKALLIDVTKNADLVDYKSTSVAVGKGGVIVNSGKGKPGGGTHVVTGGKGGGVNPGPNPSIYKYAATETQVHDDPGKMMNLQFTENTNTATFLPRQKSTVSSVKPGSREAEVMEETIRECENPGVEGEEKDCATSLESMIDFSTSKLRKNVQAISTEVES